MTNKLQDAFDRIEATEEMKTATLQFLQAEREKQTSKPGYRHVWKNAFAVVCMMVVLLIGLGGYYSVQKPISYVSIDVNPSVELALNRYDRVVSAVAYNEDGVIVLDSVDVKGKRYTDAIDIIVESTAMQPYLTQDSALTFTVAAENEAKENAILSGIDDCTGCREHGGQSYTAGMASVEEAHANGLSLGKYKAYLILAQYDSTVSAQDCQSMTMSEIHSLIRAHEADGTHGENSGENCDGENLEGESGSRAESGNRNESGTENENGTESENGSENGSGNRNGNGSGNGHGSGHENGTGNGHGHWN